MLLIDKNREYQRNRHSSDEKQYLASQGLQHVESSNVSSVGSKDGDLIIRFLNGSLYRYMNYGDRLEDILNANSKGKWVWRYLRRANVPYQKIGVISFPSDLQVDDVDIFKEIDNLYVSDLTKYIEVPITTSQTNSNVTQLDLGGLKVFQTNVVNQEQSYIGGLNKVINSNVDVNLALGLTVFNVGGIEIYKAD